MTARPFDMAEVVIRTKKGTWHRAIHNLTTDTVLSPEGCNLDDADSSSIELYPSMPEFAAAIDLCKRCYATETDR